ncbi:hypothetical protein BKA56DRAFT_596090 [Ilyonectria sp. MPI-CAGE-AT-0026]|nr:hypothetical protein BKA56DRAFT_596090 [Ilyonectria sp. MPI-CAGE-AT-0026]
MPDSPLPPLYRVVAGHNAEGKAEVIYNDKIVPKPTPAGAAVATIWLNNSAPADISLPGDRALDPVGMVNNGSVFRVVDIPPNTQGHMHRTLSLDYGLVTKGTLTMILDDGSKTKVSEGFVMIQQGTMHQWANETNEWARLVGVMVPAHPPVINGKELRTDTASLDNAR